MDSGKENTLLQKQQEQLRAITGAIREILAGVEYEDDFYKHILNKMVVVDAEHIDVQLHSLPFTWRYAISRGSPQGGEGKRSISDASVPMSVSSPFSSSKGME